MLGREWEAIISGMGVVICEWKSPGFLHPRYEPLCDKRPFERSCGWVFGLPCSVPGDQTEPHHVQPFFRVCVSLESVLFPVASRNPPERGIVLLPDINDGGHPHPWILFSLLRRSDR